MIAKKTWREVRIMAFAYYVMLQVLLLIELWYWPLVRPSLQKATNPLLELIPAEFMKRWVQDLQATGYAGYVYLEHFFKDCNVVGIACAVLIGTGAIARERETGTLEFLLSRPISRGRILWAKFWVMALCVVVPIYLSSLSLLVLSAEKEATLGLGDILIASTHASLFCLIFLALTLLVSILAKAQVHVAFIIGGFVIFEVGIYFVSGIRKFSIFRLADYDVYQPLAAGNLNFERFFFNTEIWLILALVLIYAVCHQLFKRTEL